MSVINTNITSMIGQSNLNKSQNALQTSMERLSSGLRINSAKDDAAGQAIANRMTAQINGLNQAQRNANDGISLAQTAEGALNQINDNLQRIRELTVQAQNGTNSQADLQSIQEEIDQRLAEIDRISQETNFNGVRVLNEGQALQIQVGANDGETIDVNLQVINRETLGLNDFRVASDQQATAKDLEKLFDAEGTTSTESTSTVTFEGTEYTLNDDDEFVDAAGVVLRWDGSNLTTAEDDGGDPANTYAAATAANIETELGEEAIVETEVEVTSYTIGDDTYTANADGLITDEDGNAVYLSADENGEPILVEAADRRLATDGPLEALDDALNQVDSLRSELGAVQNRFEDAIINLNTNSTNLSAARSRIEDADYAVEVANMTRAQILQQAGTSVLAQANQIPQNVLSLLG